MPEAKVTGIAAAVVAALAAIGVALIQYHPWRPTPPPPNPAKKPSLLVTGAVIDEHTNDGIRTADISLVGRTESYTTEETGNFRIVLPSDLTEGTTVRLHVTKAGYMSADRSFTPPAEGVVIALSKTR